MAEFTITLRVWQGYGNRICMDDANQKYSIDLRGICMRDACSVLAKVFEEKMREAEQQERAQKPSG